MSRKGGVLIVGVGSFHGDDRVGWYIARRLSLSSIGVDGVCVRTAQVPLDLMNWMSEYGTMHVIDACESDFGDRCWRRIDWSDSSDFEALDGNASDNDASKGALRFVTRHASGTHGWSLPDVLKLAGRLGQLPSRVVIWAVESKQFEPGTEIAARVVCAANEVVEMLISELRIGEIPDQRVNACTKSPS
jgi:Ni,Fe-hydrogenase maturation factor